MNKASHGPYIFGDTPVAHHGPDFSLPNTEGKTVCLTHFAGAKALVVVFMCNYCPYVIHVADELASLAKQYQDRGAAFVGTNTNDVAHFPDDSPQKMVQEKEARGYTFD